MVKTQRLFPHVPFGFHQPEDSPGFLLWQTTVMWQRMVKKVLDPHAISHAQFVIMALLLWFEQHHQKPTQILLANRSKLDKMTVSKSLKKLAQQNLIRRAEHSIDTRAKSVALTEQGKKLTSTLVPLVEKVDKAFFGTMLKRDQQKFVAYLSNLIKGTDD